VSSCGCSLIKKKKGLEEVMPGFLCSSSVLGALPQGQLLGRTLLKPESKCFLFHSVDFAFVMGGKLDASY